ncbi:MAG: hypothetical protein GY928_39190 [Colwellia sp.]|nr:hypothetical protein [Colwellia sp.]
MDENGNVINDCSDEYEPVCGKDGVTYGNLCRMESNNVDLAYERPCGELNDYTGTAYTFICPLDNSPVCAKSGINYESKCVLNGIFQIASKNEPCASVCKCEITYKPVCGIDGLTYDNECMLDCVTTPKFGKGECASLLQSCDNCSRVYTPVCGKDGKSYRNLCEMKCNGAKY